MRAPALAVALLLLVVLASPLAAGEDFAAVSKVSRLLIVDETPQLAPGESGVFAFHLNSTYAEPMLNVRLNVSIYEYATIEESRPVDATWPYPFPKIQESGGREVRWELPSVGPGERRNLTFTVLTAADSAQMPHGSIFSQASYFLRFWLEFDGNVSGTLTHYRMASRGFFTEAQWDLAGNETYTNPCIPPWCRGGLNLTILGVDGVLSDSAFGVLEPIPRWPFYLLLGLAGFFLVLAFLYWVEENPSAYPGVAAWWDRTRGRLRRIAPRIRKRKPAETEHGRSDG